MPAAVWTFKPIGPAQLNEGRVALLLASVHFVETSIAEPFLKLDHVARHCRSPVKMPKRRVQLQMFTRRVSPKAPQVCNRFPHAYENLITHCVGLDAHDRTNSEHPQRYEKFSTFLRKGVVPKYPSKDPHYRILAHQRSHERLGIARGLHRKSMKNGNCPSGVSAAMGEDAETAIRNRSRRNGRTTTPGRLRHS